jgi:chemotaxis protein MotB
VKKKHQEHENHERWLVSYADFITLLFAFFVVMFAISQVDAQKLGRFVESVNVAFELQGVLPPSSSQIINPQPMANPGGRPVIVPPKISVLPTAVSSRLGQKIKRDIEKRLAGSSLAGAVSVREDKRGVVVSLAEAGFFDPGSAAVRPDSLGTLQAVGQALCDVPNPIAVEGHTDNRPIRTPAYPSNWELSTARATNLVRVLIDSLHCDPSRLSATGYAEYRPLGDNATAAGRGMNRRVDIVVETEGSGGLPPA